MVGPPIRWIMSRSGRVLAEMMMMIMNDYCSRRVYSIDHESTKSWLPVHHIMIPPLASLLSISTTQTCNGLTATLFSVVWHSTCFERWMTFSMALYLLQFSYREMPKIHSSMNPAFPLGEDKMGPFIIWHFVITQHLLELSSSAKISL